MSHQKIEAANALLGRHYPSGWLGHFVKRNELRNARESYFRYVHDETTLISSILFAYPGLSTPMNCIVVAQD